MFGQKIQLPVLIVGFLGQPVWSVLSQRRLDNMRIIREILEQPEVSPSPESLSSYSPAVKARHFYESCMDPSGLREKIGAQPLHDIIKDVGGWSLTGDGNRTALYVGFVSQNLMENWKNSHYLSFVEEVNLN